MLKQLIIVLLLVSTAASAQKTKTKVKAKGTETAVSTSTDTPEEVELTPEQHFELTLPIENEIDGLTGKLVFHKDRKIKNDSARTAYRMKVKKEKMSFRVYTKKPNPKKPAEKMQLCINITAKDTFLLYCVNDTICKDPEVSRLLFEKSIGDTTYMLIYVDAFTKSSYNGGACNGGKETKLYFVRWAPKAKAIWKTKTISSCMKTITNMTKTPILEWDKQSPLVVSYNKGDNFIDVTFDPEKPLLGFQTGVGAVVDPEAK